MRLPRLMRQRCFEVEYKFQPPQNSGEISLSTVSKRHHSYPCFAFYFYPSFSLKN